MYSVQWIMKVGRLQDFMRYGILNYEGLVIGYTNVYFDNTGELDRDFAQLTNVIGYENTEHLMIRMQSLYDVLQTVENSYSHITNAYENGEITASTLYANCKLVMGQLEHGLKRVSIAEIQNQLKDAVSSARNANLNLRQLEEAQRGLAKLTEKKLIAEVRDIVDKLGKRVNH